MGGGGERRKRINKQSQTGQTQRNNDRLPLETLHRRLVVDRVKAAERKQNSFADGTNTEELRSSPFGNSSVIEG